MAAPGSIASYEETVYVLKEGELLKLGNDLKVQKRVQLDRQRMYRPQLTASSSGVYLSGYKKVRAFSLDLEPRTSVKTDSLVKEGGKKSGLQLPIK
jgi:hypothetical protein